MNGKATKKPVEIDWFKWEDNLELLKEWLRKFGDSIEHTFEVALYRCPNCPPMIKVKTLEGASYKVPKGYIIIRGVKGEYYPCEPGIFGETYI